MITMAILPLVLAMLAIACALAFLRLLRGPDMVDRVLALDTLYVLAMAVIVLLQAVFATRVYFEAALIIALLGFVATAAFARMLERDRVIR
jgi:multicomponent K+:H+ antiporter subunit F